MRLSVVSLAGLALIGCLPEPEDKADPFAAMDCNQKIEAIAREVREYQAAQNAAAKVSVRASDSAQASDPVPAPDSLPVSGPIPADSTGSDTARKAIPTFRPYPPVAGLDPSRPDYVVEVTDSRGGGSGSPDSPSQVVWIPPVGFDSGGRPVGSLPDSAAGSGETTLPTAMPVSISAVQIVTGSAYVAHVRIYDRRNALIREFDQRFGYNGELANPSRSVPGGYLSYLVWDNKDASGKTVPSGVYLWNARLFTGAGTETTMAVKTGYIGEECSQAL